MAFASNQNGKFDIFTMKQDGTNQRQISDLEGMDCNFPNWSLDAQYIAFSCYIQFSTYSALYVVKPDGSDLKQLTTGEVSDTNPIWLDNNQTIAFASDRSGQSEIYLLNVNNLDVRQLTYEGGDEPSVFSP